MDRPRTPNLENGPKAGPALSPEEMTRRLAALRRHMAEHDVDAVLFTSIHDVDDFAGFVYRSFALPYGVAVNEHGTRVPARFAFGPESNVVAPRAS